LDDEGANSMHDICKRKIFPQPALRTSGFNLTT